MGCTGGTKGEMNDTEEKKKMAAETVANHAPVDASQVTITTVTMAASDNIDHDKGAGRDRRGTHRRDTLWRAKHH